VAHHATYSSRRPQLKSN